MNTLNLSISHFLEKEKKPDHTYKMKLDKQDKDGWKTKVGYVKESCCRIFVDILRKKGMSLQKPKQPKALSKKDKAKKDAAIQKAIEFKDRLETKAQKSAEKETREKQIAKS
jgi:hypothetical protein